MGLKDFLWGTKKSYQYTDRDKYIKQETLPKREPVKYDVQKYRAPIEPKAEAQEPLIADRQKEETPKTEIPKREFFEFKRPIYKDVVVLVIENSVYTRNYKEKILQLANKIIELNKECFFLLVRMGDGNKTYDILDYDSLAKSQILQNWFEETIAQPCNYSGVIRYIEEYYRTLIGGFEYWDINAHDAKKYTIQNINVVFIGSGNDTLDEEPKKECIQLLKSLKSKIKVKSIKYFCTLDTQTINVAKVGFPVIGHIETDFYK